jgi:hypothetical protein
MGRALENTARAVISGVPSVVDRLDWRAPLLEQQQVGKSNSRLETTP